ncbi:MAG: hypothetical protein ACREQJ_04210, partial [Candidatus Binatia bacterium]
TYAPRGAAAAFFLAAAASFACGRCAVALVALGCAAALHVGLGAMLAAVCTGAAVLVTATERRAGLRAALWFAAVLATPLLAPREALGLIGCVAAAWLLRDASWRQHPAFHERLAAFSVFFVILAIAVVTPLARHAAGILPIPADRVWLLYEMPRRFVGAELVAFAVLATSMLDLRDAGPRTRRHVAVAAIVVALVLGALSMRRSTNGFAFAHDPCSATRPLPLPESLDRLRSSDRPELILSLAAFLLDADRGSEDRDAGADRDQVLDE